VSRRLPSAKGHIATSVLFLRSETYNKGMVVKLPELLGTQSKNPIFNSVAKMLKLGKSIENHRKIRKKCKLNFVGFLVKSTTTFVILAKAVS
jgi:hypothetical protein